jgi:TPR repeat protein
MLKRFSIICFILSILGCASTPSVTDRGVQYYNDANFPMAVVLFEKGVKQGDPSAMTHLGSMYLSGKGVDQNSDKALSLFEQGAAAGDSMAQLFVGQNRLYKHKYEEAFRYFLLSAKQGNEPSQLYLSDMYLQGLHVEKDESQSFEWLKKSAEGRWPDAQYRMGRCYLGKTVCPIEIDYEKALYYFSNAANQGSASASYELGYMYENGKGLERDASYAYKFYLLAAKLDFPPAQYAIGRSYILGGLGLGVSYRDGYEWMSKAADQNLVSAYMPMGFMYEKGLGVDKNLSKALEWYIKAESANQEGAKEIVKKLRRITQ